MPSALQARATVAPAPAEASEGASTQEGVSGGLAANGQGCKMMETWEMSSKNILGFSGTFLTKTHTIFSKFSICRKTGAIETMIKSK